MPITVSIPTILRTHTDGEKRVTASGGTLKDVISDLESNYSGISERLLDEGKLQRFVNIYVNDEDVRFLGALDAKLNDGDSITILPAVAGGALGFAAAAALLGRPSNHPAAAPDRTEG